MCYGFNSEQERKKKRAANVVCIAGLALMGAMLYIGPPSPIEGTVYAADSKPTAPEPKAAPRPVQKSPPANPTIVGGPLAPMVITGEKEYKPYKLVRLRVENAPVGHALLWDIYPPENVDAATQKLKSVYEFIAPPGQYRARARAIKGDDVAYDTWYDFTIGGSVPPVPVPPNPPIPPVPPVPPVPDPLDAFTREVVDSYALEPPATRQAHTKQLASLYGVASTAIVNDPNVKTNADLFNQLLAASSILAQQNKLPKDALQKVRATVGKRLTGTPEQPGTLRSAGIIDRPLATKELKAVADALNRAAITP